MTKFGFPISYAWVFGLSACVLVNSCIRQQLPLLSEDEQRNNRVVVLENVIPNATSRYTFEILNSSNSAFQVTNVKAPCLCLFEKDLVGIQIEMGDVLEVPCVLPVGSTQETVNLEIFTNSHAPDLQHFQLKLTAIPKLTFVASPSTLKLNSQSGEASQELIIHSEEASLTESVPKIFTSNELVTVNFVEFVPNGIKFSVSINQDVAPIGRSFDRISFQFDDALRSQVDVMTKIDRATNR